jgi:hypothetical protein
MKTLVQYNAGASATTANGRIRDGVIEGITVAADGGFGNVISKGCAYENLLEALQKIAAIGGGDFDLVKTGAATWQFRWYTGQRGTDRTDSVLFALERGNMAAPEYTHDRVDERTVAIVAGQGEESDRAVEVRTGPDYAADNDIETFVEASDLTTTAGLQSRGDTELEESRARQQFEFAVLQTPGCFYGVHYGLGDLVKAQYGITTPLRAKGSGTLPNAVSRADTIIELGRAITEGDYVLLRRGSQREVVQVGALQEQVVNLCSNPSFEGTYSGGVAPGWVAYAYAGATGTRAESVDAYVSSKSQRITSTGVFSWGVQTAIMVMAATHAVSIWYRVLSYTPGASLRLLVNPDGLMINRSLTADDVDKWKRLSVAGSLSAGLKTCFVSVGSQPADVLIDAYQLEQSDLVTPYCDGDQDGCRWEGTPHASRSLRADSYTYEVTRDADGKGAHDWPSGTPFVVLASMPTETGPISVVQKITGVSVSLDRQGSERIDVEMEAV